jgi:hypothetical protein
MSTNNWPRIVVSNGVLVVMRPCPKAHPYRIAMTLLDDLDEAYQRLPSETHEVVDIIDGWYVSRELFHAILRDIGD